MMRLVAAMGSPDPTVAQYAAGAIANLAGFGEGLTIETARSAAYAVFAVATPVAALAILTAWRLTPRAEAAGA